MFLVCISTPFGRPIERGWSTRMTQGSFFHILVSISARFCSLPLSDLNFFQFYRILPKKCKCCQHDAEFGEILTNCFRNSPNSARVKTHGRRLPSGAESGRIPETTACNCTRHTDPLLAHAAALGLERPLSATSSLSLALTSFGSPSGVRLPLENSIAG